MLVRLVLLLTIAPFFEVADQAADELLTVAAWRLLVLTDSLSRVLHYEMT